MSIKQWSKEERPRERVEALGVEAVSNAELLAILIGSGTSKRSSVELMRDLLSGSDDSLRSLATRTLAELQAYDGIGPAKAITIQAAMELGKRLMRESRERVSFSMPDQMYEYLRTHMLDKGHEECHVMLLDSKNQLITRKCVSRGGISESVADIRLILREALMAGAVSIVFAHNHPSGNPAPSRQDDSLTQRLAEACRAVNIRLTDHIIVGDNRYYSYYEEGRI